MTVLMKNQFYDTLNSSALEVVCFKQIKSSFRQKNVMRYTVYTASGVARLYTTSGVARLRLASRMWFFEPLHAAL